MSGDERRGWPRDPRVLPPDLAAAVALGREMGRRFAEFDWTAHPLGPPQAWPTEMRAAVAMVLTSSFPIVLWLDTDQLFLIYNDAYIPILADRHPAALGQRGQYAWWDVWGPVEPMLAGVIETGQATWSHDLMLPIVTVGRRRERFFTFTYSPLIGDDGSTFGIICPSYETTERVLSERRLRLLNAVASALLDMNTIDDMMRTAVEVCERMSADVPFLAAYVGDRDTDDVSLRAATSSVRPLLPRTLAKLTKSAAVPRARSHAQVIENVATMIDGIHEALGDECPDHALLLPLGEGAAAGALLVGTNPLALLDEQYVGFCQLLADQLSSAMASAVSYEQQRRRADALAELDHAKTAFLTNVSHEFRTPLTLLLGPLEDALSDSSPDSAIEGQLTMARRSAVRLKRMVDSLLDFSRIEAGRATADLMCIDIGALTSHIASSFSELCERAGLKLILDCRQAVAEVDPGMWETILLNLLSNAVKYTMAGTITVISRSDASFCRIIIRDTGVGIAEADLKRLGERFFRVEDAQGRSVEGTGIGLSLVQGLVDLQHGTVEIDSELGRGTAVTIRLPRSTGQPADPVGAGLSDNPYVVEADRWVKAPSDAAPTADGRELVLIADDNADMRAHLERVLSVHWRTVCVVDGLDALEATRTWRPDVIVTDVMMPRLDGFELVEAIRSDPALAATPVLMLSARAGADAVSEGFAAGADDYLPKPFASQDLIDRVTARLSAAARERTNRRSTAARAQQALDFAQLDAALQSAESATAIVAALQGATFVTGEAPIICLGVLDAEDKNLRFEYGAPVPPEIRDRYHVASMDTPIVPVDVVKTGQPMIITDTMNLSSRYQHVVSETVDAVRSCISQPLRGIDQRVIGSLGMLWSTPREFDPAELEWAAQVARITQSTVDRIRHVQREHRIAVDFQDHLLDLDHGSTAAVVAAVYQPGGEAMRVGGDWYLVMPQEQQGRIAISVGDVVGHGLPAAIAMSRLRAGVAASALADADPGAVLATLDRYAATVPGARCATVSYAVIDDGSDPDTGDGTAHVRYSCAGHPYPLLVTPDQPPVFLTEGRRPPVAAWESPLKRNTAEHELPAGSVILLYTDGLIERPGESLDDGFARLQGAAAYRADLPVGDLCDELLERMAPPDGYTDDVVLLALRPCHSSPRSFATVVCASLDNIADARHRLRDWLSGVDVDAARESDILLATGEAVTNAIEHGSGGDCGMTVSIEAFVRGQTVTATVSDAGRWTGDSSASQRSLKRGRGLTMINGLADSVKTVRTAAGTRITLTFERAVLPAPADLAEGVTP